MREGRWLPEHRSPVIEDLVAQLVPPSELFILLVPITKHLTGKHLKGRKGLSDSEFLGTQSVIVGVV